jgi:uncharacterized protein (UPF0333 family)
MDQKSQIISIGNSRLGQNKGQIVVEYVLLLLVAVALALLLVRGLVGNGDSKGVIIQAWSGLVDFVRNDKADDVAP